MCKLYYYAFPSETHAKGNNSLLMSTEGPFVASQEIQGSLLFKLLSMIFIKDYELWHILGKIKP